MLSKVEMIPKNADLTNQNQLAAFARAQRDVLHACLQRREMVIL